MAGNPYHDAAGKFCAKETAIESYENEMADAVENDEFQRYSRLKKDYESMMIEADPQSEVAQKALKRDYGTFAQKVRSDTVKKTDRQQRKIEKRFAKSENNRQKLADRFDNEMEKYKKKGYSEESAIKAMKQTNFNWSNNVDDLNLYHPDRIVKPVGKFKEVPASQVKEGDIITVSIMPSLSGPVTYTGRLKKFGHSNSIVLDNSGNTETISESGYNMGDSIEEIRKSGSVGDNAYIQKIVRDEGAKDFLKKIEKFNEVENKKRKQIKELEEQKRKLEQEINSARGY